MVRSASLNYIDEKPKRKPFFKTLILAVSVSLFGGKTIESNKEEISTFFHSSKESISEIHSNYQLKSNIESRIIYFTKNNLNIYSGEYNSNGNKYYFDQAFNAYQNLKEIEQLSQVLIKINKLIGKIQDYVDNGNYDKTEMKIKVLPKFNELLTWFEQDLNSRFSDISVKFPKVK